MAIQTLLIILWLIFPFGQFLKVDGPGGTPFYLFDAATGFLFLLVLLRLWGQRDVLFKNLLFLSWLCFCTIAAVSLLFSPLKLSVSELAVSSLYLARWVVGSGLIFIFLAKLNGSLGQKLAYLMLIGALGIAASGIAQYILFPYLGPITIEGWDPHLFRLVGSFLDPGFTGIILVFGLILISFRPLFEQLSLKLRSLIISIFYVSLLLTYSRASYLAFLASFGYLSLKRQSYKWFAKLVILFTVSILLLPRPLGEGVRLERENSLKARIENWGQTLQLFSARPLLGVGFDTVGFARTGQNGPSGDGNHARFGSDSSLLLISATTGVLGIITAGLFFVTLIKAVLGILPIYLSRLALASFVAVFVHSWFLNSLFYPWVLVWLSLLIGLTLKKHENKSFTGLP